MLPLMFLFAGTLVGIWSFFIEPSFVQFTTFSCPLSSLPPSFEGLKVFHFSDIHFRNKPTHAHLYAIRKVQEFKPDLILFTGDFLCHSNLKNEKALKAYLNSFEAPLGCFAILGNHDYATHASSFRKSSQKGLPPHPELVELLKQTPFTLLRNQTVQVKKGEDSLNLLGLGDVLAGDMNLQEAFSSWDPHFPGIVLTHNPETFTQLAALPGELVLSGHTHGNQVNLPLLRALLPGSSHLRRGLVKQAGKTLYINRGLGAHLSLRLLSRPEICLYRCTGTS